MHRQGVAGKQKTGILLLIQHFVYLCTGVSSALTLMLPNLRDFELNLFSILVQFGFVLMDCRDVVVFKLGLNFLADKNLISFFYLGPKGQSCRAQLIL